jgi:hypothetical protein
MTDFSRGTFCWITALYVSKSGGHASNPSTTTAVGGSAPCRLRLLCFRRFASA